MRHRSPRRDIRLHRFQADPQPLSKRLMRRAARLPLLMPLCAGIMAAGAIDAVLPDELGDDDAVALYADDDIDSAVGVAGDAIGAAARRDAASVPQAALAPSTGPSVEGASAAVADVGDASDIIDVVDVVDVASPTRPAVPTRDAELEADIQRLLENGKTPMSAVVVLEARTGRVVAIAEHATRGEAKGLALKPMAPAASVFKVVTASALLEAGVSPREKVCYHGGRTRMKPTQLTDSKRDGRCVTFADVVPLSTNVAVAKLAKKHLTPDTLRTAASRWGFGQDLGVAGLTPSLAHIPNDAFAFAEAAAGFGDVKISAMHGAVLASIVANDGVLVTPTFDATVTPLRTRAIGARQAETISKMLADTVSRGTARRAFRGAPKLKESAAGKTGSLTDYDTGLDTSWFVGFAPVEAPEFVVAAVVVNTGVWHIKAPWLAKEALRLTFRSQGKKGDRVAAR